MRVWVALGCGLAAAALLAAVPVLAGLDASAPPVPTPADGAWWAGLAVVAGQALLLLAQPARPLTVLVAVAAGAPVGAALGLQAAVGVTSAAVLVATFLAVLAPRPLPRRLGAALAAAAALVALGECLQQVDTGTGLGTAVASGLVQGVGSVGLAALAGYVVRARRDTLLAQADRTRALAQEQAALVEVAVARERTAMARELHDIAAHHLSGIAMMTGAIGRQIDTDPAGAKLAVREVREHSKALLADLRNLVGLLRTDPADHVASAVREESLAGIEPLVDTARRAGADVTLTLYDDRDGRPATALVGPLAQLSAYRTVQEALANAARHAPGAACEVVVDARGDAVQVAVVNAAPPRTVSTVSAPASGGYGLVGMRERAELTGADLAAGPTPDGGWRVALRLPLLDQPSSQESR